MADHNALGAYRRCYAVRNDGIDMFWLSPSNERITINPWPGLAKLDQAGQISALRRIGYRLESEFNEPEKKL